MTNHQHVCGSCLGGEPTTPKVLHCHRCGDYYSSAIGHECDPDNGPVVVTYLALAIGLAAIALIWWELTR